jgi:anti-sigma B factor antagonist
MFSVELSVRDIGGQAVIALRGELDLASTPAAAAHLIAAVSARGPSVIVDLGALDYIGYSGLGVLVRVRKWALENGGDLALAAPVQQVRRILEATGLVEVFAIYPTVQLAVSAGRPQHAAPAPRRTGADTEGFLPGGPADLLCGRYRLVSSLPGCTLDPSPRWPACRPQRPVPGRARSRTRLRAPCPSRRRRPGACRGSRPAGW